MCDQVLFGVLCRSCMLSMPLELVALCKAPLGVGVDDAPECSVVKQRVAPKRRAVARILQRPHDIGAIRPGCRRKGLCRGLRQASLHRMVLDAVGQMYNWCPRGCGAARKASFDTPSKHTDWEGTFKTLQYHHVLLSTKLMLVNVCLLVCQLAKRMLTRHLS